MAETREPRPSVGISNRESPTEEAEERREHPPVRRSDAGGGESAAATKQGSRSSAQKASESKYTDQPMPATTRRDGAFGREPEE
jgi:hypothetical protein